MYEDWDDVTDEVPQVHEHQTSIPEPTNTVGELGSCYWCDLPAVFGRIDIGLPKRPHAPRPLVQACDHHYRHTVAPALRERERERIQRRLSKKFT